MCVCNKECSYVYTLEDHHIHHVNWLPRPHSVTYVLIEKHNLSIQLLAWENRHCADSHTPLPPPAEFSWARLGSHRSWSQTFGCVNMYCITAPLRCWKSAKSVGGRASEQDRKRGWRNMTRIRKRRETEAQKKKNPPVSDVCIKHLVY